ncbi:IclR family transcriptional regulator [Paenibacillus validus]|uniref:IclR family transcriptional regulator n=1 Tax=Paenibacillus validus TaxID=44253 RepID=UPI000FDBB9C4|nr:IclR family transcriptional regulator [Paenibacillus validus]MED4600989.1 IclR family transcriptional regulator [Paenibacillus validus]MED4604964.1 IclR family transcriptional regulator [Paenibacillus validus]
MEGTEHQQVNSTVERALILLELVSEKGEGVALAELVKEVDLPKTTIYRLLETLKNRNYVQFDPDTEKYSIGLKTLEIGVLGLHKMQIVEVASRHLRELSEITGETSFLATYNSGETVYLYKIEGSKSISIRAELGMRRPVHCTAVGKAILSTYSREEVDRIIQEKGMTQYTPNTIVDLEQFHEELRNIRIAGYAMDREEIEVGLTCYAVPIYNYTGRSVGTISLGGPASRMIENKNELTRELMEAGLRISQRLGFVPSISSIL